MCVAAVDGEELCVVREREEAGGRQTVSFYNDYTMSPVQTARPLRMASTVAWGDLKLAYFFTT